MFFTGLAAAAPKPKLNRTKGNYDNTFPVPKTKSSPCSCNAEKAGLTMYDGTIPSSFGHSILVNKSAMLHGDTNSYTSLIGDWLIVSLKCTSAVLDYIFTWKKNNFSKSGYANKKEHALACLDEFILLLFIV